MPTTPPKKRCLLWDYTNTRDSPTSLDALNFSTSLPIISLHNWNTWTPPELKNRLPFRPMIRDLSCTTGQDWENILSFSKSSSGSSSNASNSSIIHFFNEPERQNISVEKAVEIWNEKLIPLRNKYDIKLVSPSCANDSGGQEWLDSFLSLLSNPPDYLGLHYYGTESSYAISFFESLHTKYPTFPIVVSEIACVSREREEVFKFTKEMIEWFDAQEWIVEYGWFGCMRNVADGFVSPEAQLMDEKGEFTELMGLIVGKDEVGCGE